MGTQLSPKGHSPQFSAHVYCGQTVAHLSYCPSTCQNSFSGRLVSEVLVQWLLKDLTLTLTVSLNYLVKYLCLKLPCSRVKWSESPKYISWKYYFNDFVLNCFSDKKVGPIRCGHTKNPTYWSNVCTFGAVKKKDVATKCLCTRITFSYSLTMSIGDMANSVWHYHSQRQDHAMWRSNLL